MNIAKIMALTEASSGYNGGSYVDEMPHLSLTEAAGQLSMFLMESQIDLSETTVNNNESLVEAAVSAMETGTPADFDSLVEASWADIKAKIDKIMEKIKKFIRSIIAKLTLAIDKMRMSGHQLYAKYKDAPVLKDTSKFKDLKVNGYKFEIKGRPFPNGAKYDTDVEALIQGSVGAGKFELPSAFADKYANVKADEKQRLEEANTKVNAIKDMGKSERVLNMAKALTGFSDLGEDWQKEVRTKLYGSEKVDLKYGTDYTMDDVIERLRDPKYLDDIKNEYKKLETAVDSYHKKLKDSLAKFEKSGGSGEEKSAGMSVATSYYNAYMTMVTDAYGAINTVKHIDAGYEEAKMDQAKIIFGKMLSFKAKKDNNDASYVDSDIEYEIEL